MPTCLYLKILKERQTVHKTFEIPLDIPDVTIEKAETNRHGDFVITVKSTIEGTYCHTCGKKITKVYGYDREIILRHLSILGKKTFIRLRPVRYQCPSCDRNPTTTQQLSWYNPRSSYTKAYEEHILLGVVNSTIQDVCRKEIFGKQVKIVIDRFHVAKLYRKGLDTLRKQELRRLKQALSEEEYTHLQGAMWALRKPEEKRTDEEKDLLERLFIYSPQLKVA